MQRVFRWCGARWGGPAFGVLGLSYAPTTLRADTVGVTVNDTSDDLDGVSHHSSSARMSWARLLKRVFDIDVEHVPYMDPSRFARHRFVRDKKKVAAIYPAC